MKNTNIVVKDFSYLGMDKNLPTSLKREIIESEINTSRYTIMGAVNQYGKFKLKCRFHNKRDGLGRWTCRGKRK